MTRNICIGCGCDENNACPENFGGHILGCNWLCFEAKARAGVCSCCEDLVKVWRAGARKPIYPLIAERFYRQALFLFHDKENAVAWMATPQLGGILGGRAPKDLILEGRLEEVQTLLEQIRSGAHV